MPNAFMPERWEGEENKYPFFQPFGYGARNCVGNTLAELEILTMATEVSIAEISSLPSKSLVSNLQ